MVMSVNDNMGSYPNNSALSAMALLDTLELMRQVADQMLAKQNKVVNTLIKEDQKQARDLERLTKKLEAARVPQTMQQLKAIQAKIEEALPKFQQLGDTDTAAKLTAMLNNVEDMKQQMAVRQGQAAQAAPPSNDGNLYA